VKYCIETYFKVGPSNNHAFGRSTHYDDEFQYFFLSRLKYYIMLDNNVYDDICEFPAELFSRRVNSNGGSPSDAIYWLMAILYIYTHRNYIRYAVHMIM